MRISPTLNVSSIPSLITRFLGIIGADAWTRRYRVLRDQIRDNPLLEPCFADSHGFELRLGKLLDSPHSSGRFVLDLSSVLDYALVSFIAPVVLIYEQLTGLGKGRVAGMLRDGLNADLRPFMSEIETVTHLMHRGFDVSFQDIDRGHGFDFLAMRDGIELEIECKSVSGDLGRQVHRRRMVELSSHVWPVIRHTLASVDGGRLIRVMLPSNLHGRREILSDIAGVIKSAIETETSVSTQLCDVDWRRFDLAGSPFANIDPAAVSRESVQPFLEREMGQTNKHVFFAYRPARAAIAMIVESRKRDRVLRGLMHDLKTAAKTQLTGQRPGVLVVQFLELSSADLLDLASHGSSNPRQASALQIATNLLFDNPGRSHIHSIVYRGARGTLRQSVSVGDSRIDRSYQEQGPTYFFKNPNHTLADDPRYSLFATS
jgi:hypothetical protein